MRVRLISILEALFVTFLWSSSYILTKFGLTNIPPLTLVAYRYITASLVLIPIAWRRGEFTPLLTKNRLPKLGFLGITGYSIAQGLQCVGLAYLPAITVTLILNFTPIMVLGLGVIFLNERPSRLQLIGMILVLVGASTYFSQGLAGTNITGLIITTLSGLGWASYMVASRLLFIKGEVKPLGLTAISMGIGTLFIALSALFIDGLYIIPKTSWGIIIWLGVVNTAIAFFLWGHVLQNLEAFKLSIIQNTMLIQIALLAWVFLGETLLVKQIISLFFVFTGVFLVQVLKKPS